MKPNLWAIRSESRFLRPTKELKQLLTMAALKENARATQRAVARFVGTTVTTINQYLAEFEAKAWIEKSPTSGRDYEYRLTESGRDQLGSSQIEYLRDTFRSYSASKVLLTRTLESLCLGAKTRMAFYSAGEVTELLLQCLPACLEVVAILDDDPAKVGGSLQGHPIRSPKAVHDLGCDAVLITTYRYRAQIEQTLVDQGYPRNRIQVL